MRKKEKREQHKIESRTENNKNNDVLIEVSWVPYDLLCSLLYQAVICNQIDTESW